MKPDFNLVDRPWIPCLLHDGSPVEMGLLDVLAMAHEIREVFHPYPPVTAAVYRLLLAILHRNFGPVSMKGWVEMWRQGRFDAPALEGYFKKWWRRFDLFDPEMPFYQVGSIPSRDEDAVAGYELSPVGKLAIAPAVGNNPTLFDHHIDEEPTPATPAESAHWVVVCQAFHLGGLVSARKGEPRHSAAPAAKGVIVLFKGDNLFETLMSNLIAYDPASGKPYPVVGKDMPAWEQDPVAERVERAPYGYLDYLTWQSLRLRLFPETENGQVFVRRAIVAAGATLKRNGLREPQFAYRVLARKTGVSEGEPWLPVKFQARRALWRDSTVLLTAGTKQEIPPRARDWLSGLVAEGVIRKDRRYRMSAYGLCSFQARVDFWRREHLPVPLDYLAAPELVEGLRQCLVLAEEVAVRLEWALKRMGGLEESGGRSEGIPEALKESGLVRYWSELEQPFNFLIVDLPTSSGKAEQAWAEAIHTSARASFNSVAQMMEHSGRLLKRVVQARNWLEVQIARLFKNRKEAKHGA